MDGGQVVTCTVGFPPLSFGMCCVVEGCRMGDDGAVACLPGASRTRPAFLFVLGKSASLHRPRARYFELKKITQIRGYVVGCVERSWVG